MTQKVIYRQKAEGLAPGRSLLLNYILWGVEVCGATVRERLLPHPFRAWYL